MAHDVVSWFRPDELGIHAEAQVDAHCLAHALNTLCGREVVSQRTTYFYDFLHANCGEWESHVGRPREFAYDGNYTVAACNTYLYAHTTYDVALVPAVEVWGPPSRQGTLIPMLLQLTHATQSCRCCRMGAQN